MDVLLLRTLAWKSQMGFGKYSDLSVMEVYNLQHTLYLRWVYFNCSMISFNDEILKAIYIPDNYKIDKPGKKPENADLLKSEIQNNFCSSTKKRLNKITKNTLKRKATVHNFHIARSNSKSTLTSKNQGH